MDKSVTDYFYAMTTELLYDLIFFGDCTFEQRELIRDELRRRGDVDGLREQKQQKRIRYK